MKRFSMIAFFIMTLTPYVSPKTVQGAETTPHKIPWIKHQATIDPSGRVSSLEFGPNGEYLGVELNGVFIIYELETYQEVTRISPTDTRGPVGASFDGLEIGPKGEKFYIAAGYNGFSESAGWIEVRDIQTGKKINEIAHHDYVLNSLEFGPNRRFLVSTDFVDDVLIWDTERNHFFPILSIPDGKVNLYNAILNKLKSWKVIVNDTDFTFVYKIHFPLESFGPFQSLINSFPFNKFKTSYTKQFSLKRPPAVISRNKRFLMTSGVKAYSNLGVEIYEISDGSLYKHFDIPKDLPTKTTYKNPDSEEFARRKVGRGMAWGNNNWILNGAINGIIYLRSLNSNKKLKHEASNSPVHLVKFNDSGEKLVTNSKKIKLWSWDPPDTKPIEKTLKMQDELKD